MVWYDTWDGYNTGWQGYNEQHASSLICENLV